MWVARHQTDQIEYLKTVNRTLMERLVRKRLRFTDAERRKVGGCTVAEAESSRSGSHPKRLDAGKTIAHGRIHLMKYTSSTQMSVMIGGPASPGGVFFWACQLMP